MKETKIYFFLCFIMVVVPVSGHQEKTITDDLGNPFIMRTPPQRIISLAPNITEILFALGLEKQIIGVTRYCDYPDEAQKKEKIGGLIDSNLEKILSLNPDLILGFRGNTKRILKRMKSLQLPIFAIEMGTTLDSLFTVIGKIGTITQTHKKAEILNGSLREKYMKIRSTLRQIQHIPKVFVALHGTGLWTGGKKSFINDLVTKAKGLNIAGKINRKWFLYKREQLFHDNPEIIIILAKTNDEFSIVKDWYQKESHLEDVKAIAAEKIYYLDENLATRPGPRIIEALIQIARILHPRYFEEK